MIIETVKVRKRLAGDLEVSSLKAQACGACASRPGCGQHLFAKLLGHDSVLYVPIEAGQAENISEGDLVDVGIHEHALLALAALGYFLPVVMMIAVVGLMHSLALPEAFVAGSAIIVLLASAVFGSPSYEGKLRTTAVAARVHFKSQGACRTSIDFD